LREELYLENEEEYSLLEWMLNDAEEQENGDAST
jgi:hypothetical protein